MAFLTDRESIEEYLDGCALKGLVEFGDVFDGDTEPAHAPLQGLGLEGMLQDGQMGRAGDVGAVLSYDEESAVRIGGGIRLAGQLAEHVGLGIDDHCRAVGADFALVLEFKRLGIGHHLDS